MHVSLGKETSLNGKRESVVEQRADECRAASVALGNENVLTVTATVSSCRLCMCVLSAKQLRFPGG